MTKEQENRAIKLRGNNQIIVSTWSALSLAGGIGGVIYASKTGKSFWGKVGYFFAGSIIVSVPVGLVARPKLINNISELKIIAASDDKLTEKKSGADGKVNRPKKYDLMYARR